MSGEFLKWRRATPLFLCSTTLAALLAVRTVLVGGEVAGWDHSFHYTNAYLTYNYFLPQGTLLGYDPWHMYGWCPNMFYNLGTTLFVTLTYAALRPVLDMKSTYSLCVALSYALMAPAGYLLVWTLTGSRLAALTAALAAVTVFDEEDSWIDVGWRQVYYVGMWPQRWGLATGFAALGLLAESLRRRRALASCALSSCAGLLLAWSILSHVMMGSATALLMVLAAVFEVARHVTRRCARCALRSIAVLAVALAVAAGTIAFWAIPLLATNEEFHGLHTLTWELGTGVIGEVLSSYPKYLNALILVGPAIPLVKHRRDSVLGWTLYGTWALSTFTVLFLARQLPETALSSLSVYAALLAVAVYALTGHDLYAVFLPSSAVLLLWLATGPRTYVLSLLGVGLDLLRLPLVPWLGYGKFAGYARYLLLSYYSAVAAEVVRWSAAQARRGTGAQLTPPFILLSLAVLGFYVPALSGLTRNTDLLYASGGKKFVFIEEFPLYRNVTRLVQGLERLRLENNTYILVQDLSDNFADWKTFCHNHLVYELPLYLGKPMVGGIVWTRYVTHPISSTEYSRLFSLRNSYWAGNVERLYAQLRELGITYVVTFDNALASSLKTSGLFTELLYEPPFSVFRAKTLNPIIDVASPEAAVEDVVIKPGEVSFKLIATPSKPYRVRIRLVAFPRWRVSAEPMPSLLEFSTFRPWVVAETSWVWGYPVSSRIPFIELTIKPAARVTSIRLRHEMHTIGDIVSVSTVLTSLLVLAAYGAASLRSTLTLPRALRRIGAPVLRRPRRSSNAPCRAGMLEHSASNCATPPASL